MESIVTQQINQIRDIEQRKALNSWAKQGFVGSVIAGTGFGKSRVGVLAVEYTLKQCLKARPNRYRKKHSYSGKALILVPTVQLQEQFKEEFYKWGLEGCLDNVEVFCYQSAYKLVGKHYDIVLCDEVHLGLSPEYRKFFKYNTYDNLLCMTATLPEEEEYRDLLGKIAPTAYSITLDKCVQLGIVSPYNISCVPVTLTPDEKVAYKKANNSFVQWKYQLGQFNAFESAQMIMANKNATAGDKQKAIMFYKAIRMRKQIVDFAENKVNKFKEIYKNNTSKRILVFSGANDFTDKLCNSIKPNAMSYHSKKTKKQKELALESFKDGSINVLCSTKALNQGFDVPDANMGIICGITSKSLSMIQRVGRLIRFKEGKVGEIIILYVADSQEEKWLKNAVKNLKNITWK
jgi:superfamily II DNA or RNA helicase